MITEEAYSWKTMQDLWPWMMKDLYENIKKNRLLSPDEEISYQEALKSYYELYNENGVLKANQRFKDNGEQYILKKRIKED